MARTTPHDHPTADGEPLYRRLAMELLGELRDGTVPPGERLPGERRLAGHFGVSRETVRQALELLRRDGLVATDRRGSHATLPGPPVE
ncbi:GntR family transcriptional regulator, partial [Streptomyces afghaniensis]